MTPVTGDSVQDEMLNAVAKYLQSQGFRVAVIGASRVQQAPGAHRFNFEFVVKFTGPPPERPVESEGGEA